MSSRFPLMAVIVICMLDLWRSRRVSSRYPGIFRVLLVAGDSSHEVEGLVRYLQWELLFRNDLAAEIALSCEDGSECSLIAELLARDGAVVTEVLGEFALVFRVQPTRQASLTG